MPTKKEVEIEVEMGAERDEMEYVTIDELEDEIDKILAMKKIADEEEEEDGVQIIEEKEVEKVEKKVEFKIEEKIKIEEKSAKIERKMAEKKAKKEAGIQKQLELIVKQAKNIDIDIDENVDIDMKIDPVDGVIISVDDNKDILKIVLKDGDESECDSGNGSGSGSPSEVIDEIKEVAEDEIKINSNKTEKSENFEKGAKDDINRYSNKSTAWMVTADHYLLSLVWMLVPFIPASGK